MQKRSKKRFAIFVLAGLAAIYLLGIFVSEPGSARSSQPELSFLDREEAYRANNIGVAHLERFDYADAAAAFRRALMLDPGMTIAQINLAIALFNAQDIQGAQDAAEKARVAAPNILQTHYILGLIARNQNRTEDALAHFQRVLAADPQDVGANVNIGQIHTQQRRYSDAITAFRRAYNAETYNSTAIYNLATALIRNNEREEGQRLMEQFQALRQSGAATSIGQNYLEQGRYAEAIVSTGAEPELVDKAEPKVVFQPVEIGLPRVPSMNKVRSKTNPSRPQAATLFDYDSDGDLDLVHASGPSTKVRLFRNDGGRFTETTRTGGDLIKPRGLVVFGSVAGDFDNDGFEDLLLFGRGRPALFRGDGKGRFKDVTLAGKLPVLSGRRLSGAFVDFDHDGDLDIFLGGEGPAGSSRVQQQAAGHKLFRNNGDGTFTDVSAAAKVDLPGRAVSVVPTDYDNRRDLDLLVLSYDRKPSLFQNLRNGTFRDAGEEIGFGQSEKWTSAAAGDFNKDSFIDFFFGREGQPGMFAVSDGRGKFVLKDAPTGTQNASAAQFFDYDNDGLLDLVAGTDKGFVIARNLGDRWSAADSKAVRIGPAEFIGSPQFLSGDIDRDGDIDLLLLTRNGFIQFLRNTGAETNRSTAIDLKGRVSNRTGVGAKIDMRSGSLAQKLELYSASPMPAPSEIHFGLGRRTKPDAIRILWPSGVVQSELGFQQMPIAAKQITIEELDRKPSSCPYLYAWNGERFEFITDFLGGGEMGNWKEQGVYHHPDPDEFVRIPSDKLKPKNGRYEIRVTNELEEVLFLDHLKLVAVEHRAESNVYPNEGLGIPTTGKQILYTANNELPPLSAVDGEGRDIFSKISSLDRTFYDSFRSQNIRGYAEPHSLTLNLDNKKGFKGRTLLLLTGWTDYAFSSDNVAASQSKKSLFFPKLQVKDQRGRWQTVIDSIGISVGRQQTLVVDLTGKFLSDSREVRIVTNVKTYWDKISVDTSEQSDVTKVEIHPISADLRERGFSAEAKFGGMIVPDYEKILDDGRWKYFSGSFTRTGDVKPLLKTIDDIFLISRTGDELVLSFEALPEPPPGRTYTFLLYADGYSKEMDINSGSPDGVLPLPFKAMARYPYGPDERFPMTLEKQRIYDEYTTRHVKVPMPRIESVLLP